MLFVVLGLLQAVVTEPWQLLVVRVALGMTIGAEYAIGAAMLAEFAPAKNRGRRLCGLLVSWYVGYLAAVVVSYALIEWAGVSWGWVLATCALPAVVTLILRAGFPESPRWLVAHGRPEQAREVVGRLLGARFFDTEQIGAEQQADGGLREVFRGENRRRMLFICLFWSCNVAPYFATFTFAPTVLASLNLSNPAAGTIAVNAVAAIRAVVGWLTIRRIGRRRQLIPPLWIMAVALAVVGAWNPAPALVVVTCFAVFSFCNAMSGNLTAVYPIEILPTEVRTTEVGIAAVVSRIGAAVGTFLLPLRIEAFGVGVCMLVGAAICVLGAVVSQLLRRRPRAGSCTRPAAARSGPCRARVSCPDRRPGGG